MVLKALNVKFGFIFMILILFSINSALSQVNNANDNAFIKSFLKNFRTPKSVADSCIDIDVMLNIHFDKDYKVSKFMFSDNASLDFKNELERINRYLKTEDLTNYLKSISQKDVSLIYPVSFISRKENCICQKNTPKELYTLFSGKNLNNLCFLRNPILMYRYDVIKN